MTRIMGILNVTPDSFFDGGWWASPNAAEWQARRMESEGADVIDVGGQSTRPGHVEIPAEEELSRVVPVITALAPALKVPLSIDTYRPAVARAALAAGARWLNDVHGFQGDPAMADVAAEFGCTVVLMHHDRDFREAPGDTIEKMKRYFDRSLERAAAAAVEPGRIILDPGIGFFKRPEQNLEVLRRLPELRSLGLPLLVGASRKSFIGRVLGGEPSTERLEGTLASTVLAVQQGVEWVRVHDVRANLRAVRMAQAILTPRMTGRILLKNMAFYGYHGHHPGETAQGQRFFLDLVFEADISEAAATDSLGATVDYGRVHELCRRIVEQEKVKLLETLSRRLIDALFGAFPRIERIELTIRKPSAPIPGVLDYVALETSADRPGRPARPRQ